MLVLGELLAGQAAKVSPDAAAESYLLEVEVRALDELALLFGEGCRVCRFGAVAPLHPPGEEVAHHAGFAGLLPLLVKASAHAVRGGLENQLGAGRHGRAQSGEGFAGVAGPARELRAMQVLHRHSTAGITVRGGDHAVLRVHLGKHDPAHVRSRGLQRAQAQLLRQPVHEAVHDAEDLLCRLLGVRHFQGHGSRPGDGFEEKARRGPGGKAHLPRLEHDVALAPVPLEGTLYRIGLERRRPAFAGAHQQQLGGQRHGDGAATEAEWMRVENGAEALQLRSIQLLGTDESCPLGRGHFNFRSRH